MKMYYEKGRAYFQCTGCYIKRTLYWRLKARKEKVYFCLLHAQLCQGTLLEGSLWGPTKDSQKWVVTESENIVIMVKNAMSLFPVPTFYYHCISPVKCQGTAETSGHLSFKGHNTCIIHSSAMA